MTLNIAHRGARSLAPENTLSAARRAFEVGADMWELDVAVTAGGDLIVMHDDSLERTTNANEIFPDRNPWHTGDFTLSEIKQLETASAFIKKDPFEQIAAGIVTEDNLTALQNEPVPTLQEALLFTRDYSWRVNVEIKRILPPMDTFPVVDKVVTLIEELNMAEQVLVSSFVPLYLKQVHTLNPAIDLAVLSKGPLALPARAAWGLNPDNEISPWQYFPGSDPAGLLTGLGSQTYHPHYSIISTEKIKLLQEAGIAVNVWTVNDSTHMKRLIQTGVNGIITDYPHKLQKILSDRPAKTDVPSSLPDSGEN